MLIGMVGTTIAPWMQFYLQAAVVEKGITAKEYAESRIEVIVGCIMTVGDRVLHHRGLRRRDLRACARGHQGRRRRRARRCKPFGQYAFLLFSAGPVQRVAVRRLHPAALHRLLRCARAWASNPA